MAEKRYFWMKLPEDFFQSKRIKKLRNLAGGDTYTIIYLKMQLKALKTDGYLFFDGVMNDFAEEIALDIDESPDDVRVTIQYLLSVGLLETNDDETYCLCFLKNQIGSETASTQRVRDFRARQKELKTLQCNADVTEVKQVGNAEIDIEKDIDIEKEKINKKEKTKQQRNIIPPELEWVKKYCKERNNNVDPEKFFDFYTSKNWFVGKTKMKDWEASVRTWEKDSKSKTQKGFDANKGLSTSYSSDFFAQLEYETKHKGAT